MYDLRRWRNSLPSGSLKVLTGSLRVRRTFPVVDSKLICAIQLKVLILSGCRLIAE